MNLKIMKKGIKVHMGGKFPTEEELQKLRKYGNFEITEGKHPFLAQWVGSTRFECPLNEWFTI